MNEQLRMQCIRWAIEIVNSPERYNRTSNIDASNDALRIAERFEKYMGGGSVANITMPPCTPEPTAPA